MAAVEVGPVEANLAVADTSLVCISTIPRRSVTRCSVASLLWWLCLMYVNVLMLLSSQDAACEL